MPGLSQIEIVETKSTTENQLTAAAALYQDRLGTPPGDKLLKTGSYLALDRINNNVAGLAVGSSLDEESRSFYLDRLDWAGFPNLKRSLEKDNWATDQGVVVRPDYSQQGLGGQLVERVVDYTRETGARGIIVSLWDNPQENNRLVKVATSSPEYIFLGRIKENWKIEKDGKLQENPCPACGFSCLCDALVFARKL